MNLRAAALGSTAAAALALLAACSAGEIPVQQIQGERVLSAQPATYRENGKPVNGTVVLRAPDGQLLSSIEYHDGFPDGVIRQWYPGGQLKIEREVRFHRTEKGGGALRAVGRTRVWCENGTLRQEEFRGSDGKSRGEHKTFTCTGQLLSLQTYPQGPIKRWAELRDGSVVLVEEGVRGAGGQFQGEHKTYHRNGQLALLEHWVDGQLEGESKQWNEDGQLRESGSYQAGKHVGLWIYNGAGGGATVRRDYDAGNFIDGQYAQAFMQAAGISPGNLGRSPLQKLRFDPQKLRYYVEQGLVDLRRKINLDNNTQRYGAEFSSIRWTYPFIRATPEAAELLLSMGADPKALDSEQRSRLHHCVNSLRDPELCSAADVRRLLELKLSAGQPDNIGNTPLHDLMYWNTVRTDLSRLTRQRQTMDADLASVAQLLLDAGADPDAQNHDGLTPLMLAAQQKKFGVAGMLLERSKKPALLDKDGLNLVHLAFQQRYGGSTFTLTADEPARVFVRQAVSRGVDPLQPMGKGGESLKTLAERSGAIEFAQFLSSLKPDS